ncbi:MAG: protein kinase [Deltaproteobacteria bacterium]|nr:protein kinase [Deltaproteobacteria bacterium]
MSDQDTPPPTDDDADEEDAGGGSKKRNVVKQKRLPWHSLEEAEAVPKAIVEQYAGKATTPTQVALAMNRSPSSSAFRSITGAAEAYGLTEGAYRSDEIALTELGRKLVAPTESGQDLEARREAILQPSVIGDFLRKYNQNRFPDDTIAKNVLQFEMQVPIERIEGALDVIKANAAYAGVLQTQGTKQFVILSPTPQGVAAASSQVSKPSPDAPAPPVGTKPGPRAAPLQVQPPIPAPDGIAVSSPRSAGAPQLRKAGGLRAGRDLDCYRLIRPLGSGHSAEVWEAAVVAAPPGVALAPGERVAIKIYRLLEIRRSEILRVDREYQLATQIDHLNVAKVYDLVLAPSRPDHSFMVMELVEGSTLKDLTPSNGLGDPLRILSLAKQLFSALVEIHAYGALHRDVKASNIMISKTAAHGEDLKLCDFGIVSVQGLPGFTASGFLGSKHSAPMEQLLGITLDERSDLYGAGAALFHAISGREMYAGQQTEAAIAQVMERSPEKIDFPAVVESERRLVSLVNRCLERDRNNRPRSAVECLAEIEAIEQMLPTKVEA